MAVIIGATLGPVRSIARGPLEHGEKIGRTRAWIESSGFYPAELDGIRSFSWMREAGRIRVQHLPRPVAYRLSLWVQPAVVTAPVQLIAAVDGVAQPALTLHPGPQQIDLNIPPADSGRAIVDLTVSQTLIPGPADRRSLGLRVDGVALEAVQSRLRIPDEALTGMAALAIAIGLAVALTLGARPLAFVLGAGAGAWIGFLVSYDAAFLGDYPTRLPALGVAITLAAIVAAVSTARHDHGVHTLRALLGFLIVVTACKIALFLHPMVAVGDSIFHVHRAQVVQRGEYFFTSITPKPYFEFPYPPGLYVAVSPLWNVFRGDTGHVWLLRSAALIAEAALAAAVYWLVWVFWRHRLAAFLSGTVTVLLPVGFYTICTSNLTNSFAQSVFGIGIALLLAGGVEWRRRWIVGVAGAVFVCAGFLSHFSTFSVGVPLLGACAAALWLGGRGVPRRAALTMAVALALTAGVSVGVYYSRFVPVYKQTIERVLAKQEPTDRSMVAPPSLKATRVISTIWEEFGTVVLLAACAGVVLLTRGETRDPLALAMAGWSVTVASFWLLAITSAVEMRASLAAQPLIAVLCGLTIARVVERGRGGRIVGVLAMAAIVVRVVSDWAGCLGLPRFWQL